MKVVEEGWLTRAEDEDRKRKEGVRGGRKKKESRGGEEGGKKEKE